jgi:hypothetical protein
MRKCELCGEKLEEDWEVYGEIGETLCVDCWYEARAEENGYEEVFGLPPHHHDLTITGSIIGSTVDDPLPETKTASGWYDLGDGWWFKPSDDPQDGGMGFTRHYRRGQPE